MRHFLNIVCLKLFICFFVNNATGLAEENRFLVIGIIQTSSNQNDSSIAVLKDAVQNKTIVVKKGDVIPNCVACSVAWIKNKQVVLRIDNRLQKIDYVVADQSYLAKNEDEFVEMPIDDSISDGKIFNLNEWINMVNRIREEEGESEPIEKAINSLAVPVNDASVKSNQESSQPPQDLDLR